MSVGAGSLATLLSSGGLVILAGAVLMISFVKRHPVIHFEDSLHG